jgi:3-oxoacyl-[acyl-carrier-protein] synthase-3
MKIPQEKLPNNIVSLFGNCSSVTIPLNTAFNYGKQLQRETCRVCFSAFGVGLAWISMVMNVGPLEVCKVVDYESA